MKEKYIFLLIVILNLTPILQGRFFPTMDGAAHLYNSNLILELFYGNEFISNYFIFNPEPVPNWSGHFFLSLFNSFLPAFRAEKIVLLIYFIGLPYAFRYLIKALNPDRVLFSYAIFPFTYSFMMILGFYNFSLAIVFFLFSFSFWINKSNQMNWKNILVLFGLLILTYFSHVLVFGLLIFFLGLHILFSIVFEGVSKTYSFKKIVAEVFKKAYPLILSAFIPLVLFVYYFYSRSDSDDYQYLDQQTLIDWIKNIRPLVGYNDEIESPLTKNICMLILIFFFGGLLARFIFAFQKNKGDEKKVRGWKALFHTTDYWIIASLIMLLLYFYLPDSGGAAGFISVRLLYLFFIFILIWIALQNIPKVAVIIGVFAILFYNSKLNTYYSEVSRNLNKIAIQCSEASDFIVPNSVVLPLNYSDNWLTGHFSNYLGIDKPMIILENYEVTTGYFPLIINQEKIPNTSIGELGQANFSCTYWISNPDSKTSPIDYIFVLGRLEGSENSCLQAIKDGILKSYLKVFENESCQLFELKK